MNTKHIPTLIAFVSLFFGSLPLSGQTYVSLDKETTVKSIQLITPSGSYWNNPTLYSILLVDENVNHSSVGGGANNPCKYAVLLSKSQLAEIKKKVASTGSIFIPKLPIYHKFYFPGLEKESDILNTINGALYVHKTTLEKRPSTTVYEYCDSKYCPDSIGSHEVAGSFQLTKSGGKYYLISGMPMNSGGTPIPWKIEEIKKTGGFGELVVELTDSQFKRIFNDN